MLRAQKKIKMDTHEGYCILFGPIQSLESVSASPQTYLRPRPLPRHLFEAKLLVIATVKKIDNRR